MKKKKTNLICWILTPLLILALNNFNRIEIQASENNLLQSPIEVVPGGQPIGVKLNTKGVLVVALSDIDGIEEKILSPAATAGIQIGDCIVEINRLAVNCCQDISDAINNSKGKEIEVTIDRNSEKYFKKVIPKKSISDNKFKIGLWIRDSTAGVGTLTFYDLNSNKFAALGHPITDSDTGTILKVSTGKITLSSIVSVKKGERGTPGELRGIFIGEDSPIGSITKNTQCGIFGETNSSIFKNKPMKIGLRSEVKEGPAKILTTIDGDKPEAYDVVIEKLLAQDAPGPKSMIIRVTDQRLLEKTGGIVQGMSGSPIIQNNKLIGAVTHVLVNKPDTGYGIYVEWMLMDAEIIKQ